jgi:hypothetical protein
MRRASAILLLGFLASACVVQSDLDEGDTTDDELATGFVKASTFNHGGLRHSRNGAGVDVDHTRNGNAITTYDANHRPIGSVAIDDGVSGGKIRVQTLERLDVAGRTMFRVWPGGTSHQGWIEATDVAAERALAEEADARAGNGAMCGSVAPGLTTTKGDAVRYVVTPKAIAPAGSAKRWKVNASNGDWYGFTGDWDLLHGNLVRAPLMWSWSPTDKDGRLAVGFSGGGVIRTEILDGESFIPCRVQPIRTALRATPDVSGAKPAASERPLSVYAAFGRFDTKTKPMYGWVLVAERLEQTGVCTMHVRCDGGPSKCPLLPLPASCKF